MKLGQLLSSSFEKIPELSIKNDFRYFLAFNKLIPGSISDMSPVKGYELHYKLKEGDVVVDAGAYPGDYAVFASRKVGEKGKVICFEPDSHNRKILLKNLKKEKYRNYIIVPKGLWDKKTNLKITNYGIHSTITPEGGAGIDVVCLDDALKELKINKVDVIKMDIEGAEIEAINGALNTLKKDKPYVAIASYHLVNGKRTCDYIEKFLSKLGYKTFSDFHKHLTTYGVNNLEHGR